MINNLVNIRLLHLGDFEENVVCQKNSDCSDKNVNNCQDGFCLCGDYEACNGTSDTCQESSTGDIYDANCGCGENPGCNVNNICKDGMCKHIKKDGDDDDFLIATTTQKSIFVQ